MKYANERRREIMDLLAMNEKCTMKALAERLGVSVRTIERDIHFLSVNEPICIDQGRHGGVYLINRKRMRTPYISDQCLEILNMIVDSSERVGYCELNSDQIGILKDMIRNSKK